MSHEVFQRRAALGLQAEARRNGLVGLCILAIMVYNCSFNLTISPLISLDNLLFSSAICAGP